MELKRYHIDKKACCYPPEENKNGEWVKYADVLRIINEKLEADNGDLIKLRDNIDKLTDRLVKERESNIENRGQIIALKHCLQLFSCTLVPRLVDFGV